MEVVWFSSGVLLSRFNVEVEAALPTAARTFVGNFRVPIAGHVDLDFGSVPARRIRPLDAAAGVHLHFSHVHIHVELHVANIDKLTVTIAKLDHHFVVALTKSALAIHQIHRQIVGGLSGKRRTSNFCRRGFVPDETRAVNQPNRDEGGADDSWQMMLDAVRWYQRRRHNWPRLFFGPIREFASPPDDVDHG